MTTNFDLALSPAATFPVSLLAEGNIAPSRTRVSRARMTNPRSAASEVRYELIASLRRRIAEGSYRVTAMQLADCMMSSVCAQ